MANIIVSGGAGALGAAVFRRLVSNGNQVIVVDLAPVSHYGSAAIGGVDLADERAVALAYADATTRLGSVDGLVNLTGGFIWQPLVGGSVEAWDRMYRINLRTTVLSCRAALEHMKGKRGAIVNVGAAGAANPSAGMAPYGASKAGVLALTESLADELRARRIRVNAVMPTIIDTPANRRDMPGADTTDWVQPDDVATVIAFLLSDQAAAISGSSIKLTMGSDEKAV
ncbi:NAD(P)-dependent dehydrogenase (short-subunit alcohol dehydrogenase family) [Sphingobium sp. OAS761]|uniref:SDR family NAD(P)-dependent oxidoreductase n=1 Tax=Sphingobium sp. OAS761 TaxID=2817901 RepID=UPI0020A0ADB2|nr:SDR family NAD(P)-dependent oxidoreductase [Sphingobium sp. OAS761]MCP1471245.1 NAD(P)-dependent dehydrogenase (short-subunit alcohol dehydrogenase family) [Sphingobium sp. OAS761]